MPDATSSQVATLEGAPDGGRPLLSLCLATYNRARRLDGYLTHHLTALEAAGIDYELVASDNCSTDETPEILARYASRYPRMRVSRQPRNVGAHANILATLRQARGEVIVSIADDDLMIADRLLAYLQRMRSDPSLVMIQAPWLLIDETRGGAVIEKFYDFPAEARFARGQHGACLQFVLRRHVFPECWLMRRSAMASIVGPPPSFTYSYFCMLAQALRTGDVLFSPEPHIAATAVSKDLGAHVGQDEAMDGWDRYRGGLELMASYARQFDAGGLPDAASIAQGILAFTCQRMAVAARLQAGARNWSNAYQILRRLHAYGRAPKFGIDHDFIAQLAAVETALLECSQAGATEIVLGAEIPERVVKRMRPIEGVRFTRGDALAAGEAKRAYVQFGETPAASARPQDMTCDLSIAMERFPVFGAA